MADSDVWQEAVKGVRRLRTTAIQTILNRKKLKSEKIKR